MRDFLDHRLRQRPPASHVQQKFGDVLELIGRAVRQQQDSPSAHGGVQIVLFSHGEARPKQSRRWVVVSLGSGMAILAMTAHEQDARATTNDTTTRCCDLGPKMRESQYNDPF